MSKLVSVHTSSFAKLSPYVPGKGYTYNGTFDPKIFNVNDTYISICGRQGHSKWDSFVAHCKQQGVEINVLVDQTAVNWYQSHRYEYENAEPEHPTRLVVYEFSHIPENVQ